MICSKARYRLLANNWWRCQRKTFLNHTSHDRTPYHWGPGHLIRWWHILHVHELHGSIHRNRRCTVSLLQKEWGRSMLQKSVCAFQRHHPKNNSETWVIMIVASWDCARWDRPIQKHYLILKPLLDFSDSHPYQVLRAPFSLEAPCFQEAEGPPCLLRGDGVADRSRTGLLPAWGEHHQIH